VVLRSRQRRLSGNDCAHLVGCSKWFWVDLVALLPLDYIVVYTATRHSGGMSDEALNYFQLFRLLRMVGARPDFGRCPFVT
jgi:hypothetical protein